MAFRVKLLTCKIVYGLGNYEYIIASKGNQFQAKYYLWTNAELTLNCHLEN